MPLQTSDVKQKELLTDALAFKPFLRLRSQTPFLKTPVAELRACSTAPKMKFSIKDFFSKCLRIWSYLLKKSLMENFIFCAVF